MSWREIIEAPAGQESRSPQKAQYSQNAPESTTSADIADIAREATAEAHSRLVEAIGPCCSSLGLSPCELGQAVATEDVVAWRNNQVDLEYFEAIARALVQRRAMDEGHPPEHYAHRAECAQCGPVWLGFSGEVLACPWCLNRVSGRPIPRPVPVQCAECAHFQRTAHPNLGHCSAGQQEAVAGLWSTDLRNCGRYSPRRSSINHVGRNTQNG